MAEVLLAQLEPHPDHSPPLQKCWPTRSLLTNGESGVADYHLAKTIDNRSKGGRTKNKQD
jgi:hypothetical protein